MKRLFLVLSAVIVYLSVCFLDMFLFVVPLIPGHGIDGYTLPQKGFFCILIAVSVSLTALQLKRDNVKDFIMDTAILWVTYWFLASVINVPVLVSTYCNYNDVFLTYAHGPDFLRQDIWFWHYFGCVIGTIVAGCILLIKRINAKETIL